MGLWLWVGGRDGVVVLEGGRGVSGDGSGVAGVVLVVEVRWLEEGEWYVWHF